MWDIAKSQELYDDCTCLQCTSIINKDEHVQVPGIYIFVIILYWIKKSLRRVNISKKRIHIYKIKQQFQQLPFVNLQGCISHPPLIIRSLGTLYEFIGICYSAPSFHAVFVS